MSMVVSPSREVRQHFSEVVDRAANQDAPTVITRRGKEVAAVVPIRLLRQHTTWEERELIELLDQRMSSPEPGIDLESVLRETLERTD